MCQIKCIEQLLIGCTGEQASISGGQQTSSFIQTCILPRVLFSESDAVSLHFVAAPLLPTPSLSVSDLLCEVDNYPSSAANHAVSVVSIYWQGKLPLVSFIFYHWGFLLVAIPAIHRHSAAHLCANRKRGELHWNFSADSSLSRTALALRQCSLWEGLCCDNDLSHASTIFSVDCLKKWRVSTINVCWTTSRCCWRASHPESSLRSVFGCQGYGCRPY